MPSPKPAQRARFSFRSLAVAKSSCWLYWAPSFGGQSTQEPSGIRTSRDSFCIAVQWVRPRGSIQLCCEFDPGLRGSIRIQCLCVCLKSFLGMNLASLSPTRFPSKTHKLKSRRQGNTVHHLYVRSAIRSEAHSSRLCRSLSTEDIIPQALRPGPDTSLSLKSTGRCFQAAAGSLRPSAFCRMLFWGARAQDFLCRNMKRLTAHAEECTDLVLCAKAFCCRTSYLKLLAALLFGCLGTTHAGRSKIRESVWRSIRARLSHEASWRHANLLWGECRTRCGLATRR